MKLSTKDYFLASHGELDDKGACKYCARHTDVDLTDFFCGGIVPGITELTDEEQKVVDEFGVECEVCNHIYFNEDLPRNGEFECCENCDDRPHATQNVEPMPYIWVWAAVHDLLPLGLRSN